MAKSKKKILGLIKLQIPAGKANPSPPVGPALGQKGLNIMEFCKAFNAATQSLEPGIPTPVIITRLSLSSLRFLITLRKLQALNLPPKLRVKKLPAKLLWLR